MRTFSPDQISEALFEVDPFRKGCEDKDRTDAYRDAPREAYVLQLQGFTIKEALVLALADWLLAYEHLHTSGLNPVVKYLQREEGS